MSKVYRILAIDDDSITREIISYTLSRAGYRVQLAKNGKEGLDLAQRYIFDLVISDLHMPVMNGLDFCVELKQMEEYKLTPFLFLSTDKKRNFKLQGLAEGADDFITKPFDPAIILAKVNACLKKQTIQKDKFLKDKLNHLNFNLGSVLFCALEGDNSLENIIPHLPSSQEVFKMTDFTNLLENSNIWLIIVVENADWALSSISKIAELADDKDAQLCFLMSIEEETNLLQTIDDGMVDIIPWYNSPELVLNEIECRLKRELSLKDKYIRALNRAAKSSPLRFEREQTFKEESLEVCLFHQPFQHIPGGDYYEVFELADGEKLVVIGDVMGKKWGAWFFVMGYIAYIRSSVRFLLSNKPEMVKKPNAFLLFLNDLIFKDIQLSEVFTTLTLVYLDKNNHSVKLASAGGLPPILYRKKADIAKEITLKGQILGLDTQTDFDCIEVKLDAGDSILVFTDGYCEAFDENNEMIRKEGVIHFFKTYNQNGKRENPEDFDLGFGSYYAIKEYSDDRTVLIVSNKG